MVKHTRKVKRSVHRRKTYKSKTMKRKTMKRKQRGGDWDPPGCASKRCEESQNGRHYWIKNPQDPYENDLCKYCGCYYYPGPNCAKERCANSSNGKHRWEQIDQRTFECSLCGCMD